MTETIRATSYATSFGAKKCSENQVRDDSAEMILDLWNQQILVLIFDCHLIEIRMIKVR